MEDLMLNDLNLIGNVGKIETKSTKEGKTVVEFSLATSKGSGEHRKTEWHSCVAFGKTAEILSKFAKVGTKLFANGSVTYQKYKPTWAEKEITRTQIYVDKFQLLDAKDKIDEVENNNAANNYSNSHISKELADKFQQQDEIPF
jgi:single-strand DNA-binding protein